MLFKDFIFMYSMSKLKVLIPSSNYVQQYTIFISNPVLQFFIKFNKASSFFRFNVLLDIAVCDFKRAFNRFGITYIFGSVLFSTRIYVRVLSDIYSFVTSISDLF